MHDDLIRKVEEAIQNTNEWPTKGWKTTFGPRKVEVNNLAAARDLPHTMVNRLEAVAYWVRVENSAVDAAQWGKKALEALKKDDLKEAEDCAYFCMIVEKPIREIAPTWEGVVGAIRTALN
jgi:hypothetical protein